MRTKSDINVTFQMLKFKFDRNHYETYGERAHVTLREYVMLDGYLYEKIYFWMWMAGGGRTRRDRRYNLFPVF